MHSRTNVHWPRLQKTIKRAKHFTGDKKRVKLGNGLVNDVFVACGRVETVWL